MRGLLAVAEAQRNCSQSGTAPLSAAMPARFETVSKCHGARYVLMKQSGAFIAD
jgi:hypothetical protein